MSFTKIEYEVIERLGLQTKINVVKIITPEGLPKLDFEIPTTLVLDSRIDSIYDENNVEVARSTILKRRSWGNSEIEAFPFKIRLDDNSTVELEFKPLPKSGHMPMGNSVYLYLANNTGHLINTDQDYLILENNEVFIPNSNERVKIGTKVD